MKKIIILLTAAMLMFAMPATAQFGRAGSMLKYNAKAKVRDKVLEAERKAVDEAGRKARESKRKKASEEYGDGVMKPNPTQKDEQQVQKKEEEPAVKNFKRGTKPSDEAMQNDPKASSNEQEAIFSIPASKVRAAYESLPAEAFPVHPYWNSMSTPMTVGCYLDGTEDALGFANTNIDNLIYTVAAMGGQPVNMDESWVPVTNSSGETRYMQVADVLATSLAAAAIADPSSDHAFEMGARSYILSPSNNRVGSLLDVELDDAGDKGVIDAGRGWYTIDGSEQARADRQDCRDAMLSRHVFNCDASRIREAAQKAMAEAKDTGNDSLTRYKAMLMADAYAHFMPASDTQRISVKTWVTQNYPSYLEAARVALQ